MFGFFAFLSVLSGIIGAIYGAASDNGVLFFCSIIMSIITTSFYVKLIGMNGQIENSSSNIASLRAQLSDMKRRLEKIENETGDVRAEYVEKKEAEENNIKKQVKKQIADDLRKKYTEHFQIVTATITAGTCSVKDIKAAILAPMDWPENICATNEKRFALYMYYEGVFQLIRGNKKLEEVALNVYEEAYRIIGFLGDELQGKDSEIMSWYFDYESKTYGKTERMRKASEKLDSLGILDRGKKFSERL